MGCTETAARSWNVTPWYTFPRIDNFGTIDPQGPFWKPDSNIQLPGHYPITALLPGTVTSLQPTTSFGGQSVATIRLDRPLNGLATHTVYQHMSGFAPGLSVGKHVNAGDPIGFNNPCGATPLGFGLYSGDVYGKGAEWQTLQNDLRPGGRGLLNPTSLLNGAKSGAMARVPTAGVDSSTGQGAIPGSTMANTGCAPWDMQCIVAKLQNAGEAIAIFVLAIILIIVGLLLIGFKPVENVAGKVAKGAMLA